MKCPRVRPRLRAGFTMLELTVVIAVLLSLASLLATGVRAWKRGADRSHCVMVLRNAQQAVRCFQNLYGYEPGRTLNATDGVTDIAEELANRGLITPNQFAEAKGEVPCQGGGTYSRKDPTRFPDLGELYMECSLKDDPNSTHDIDRRTGW